MYDEMTNLLPSERRHALARDYILRLGVIALSFVLVLTISAIVLLLPSYILLVKSVSSNEARLATVDSTLSSADEAALSSRLATLTQNAATLSALGDTVSASSLIRDVLGISRAGVTISGFTYTAATAVGNKKTPGTLAISGVALTRDALRNYQVALQNAPFAAAANLPVSAYAQDSNITFTITVTLTP